jgi:hypothetical protein
MTICLKEHTAGVLTHQNHSSTNGKYQGKFFYFILAVIFHCGHILYENDVCLVASVASSHKLLTPLVWPFDCNLGLPLSNPTDAILSLHLITDGFGLGCYLKGYIVEYLPSHSTAPSFHDTQQSTWLEKCTNGVLTHQNLSSTDGKNQGKFFYFILVVIFYHGHVLYPNEACLAVWWPALAHIH